MSNKEQSSIFSKIVVTVVIALLVGSSSPWWWSDVKGFLNLSTEERPIKEEPKTTEDVQLPTKEEPVTTPKCSSPWEWDVDSDRCVRKVTIPPKTFSVKVKSTISKVEGRIDFYTNRERLPGTNNMGQAIYKENKGALQVAIPIMNGNTMVGVHYEVIYSTNEGAICKVSSLPETTGWLKKMKIAYSLRLDADCNNPGNFCQAKLVQSGRRVHITTKELTLTIAKDCH